VIHIPEDICSQIEFLVGEPSSISNLPVGVYDGLRLKFLADLSTNLLHNKEIREYPDVATFAFWCRKSNLVKIIENNSSNNLRVGLGLIYHNSPSNVPVNFAFSLAFGILSGNSSVVRLSSKHSNSTSLILKVINDLLNNPEYAEIKNTICVVKFNHSDAINKFWILASDGKIIWGGDKTVAKMRSYESKPRSREILFPDRFSLSILRASEVIDSSSKDLNKLCESLFNDIYIMDQQACSSPQLLNWVGNDSDIKKAKSKLWPLFLIYIQTKYSLEPIQYMDKYIDACKNAILNENVISVKHENNLLFNVELSHFNHEQPLQRGFYGTIHEVSIKSLDDLSLIIDNRCQTLTYFGFEIDELKEFVLKNKLRGIDRIVPIGRSLDMGVIWDGYDIINHLSRNIDIF
jgi:hypothetical protein